MSTILVIGKEGDQLKKLTDRLNQNGFTCSVAPSWEEALDQIATDHPDLLLVDADVLPAIHPADGYFQTGLAKTPPVLVLIPAERLGELAINPEVADFALKPYTIDEVAVRVKRLLNQETDPREVIKCGDLVIHLTRYEVRLSGRLIELTFREFKLLRFLAARKGHVFTREMLLNKVWGYDYFGGDRTVDVHIRRIRSKIEDANHTFIDTVRSIGYRFQTGDSA